MAYTKQTWVDRKVEKPLTFLTTINADGSMTLTPYPGVVEQEGSQLSADRFNHIENGLSNVDTRLSAIEFVSGNWTPVLTTLEGKAPTMEYLIQRGTYKKIGKLVYLSLYIRGKITKLNGTNNYAVITGIPYSSSKVLMESGLNINGLYQMLEIDANAGALIDGNIIRVQSNYGETAGILKVTPAGGVGYFEISASGWYETY